MNIEKSEHAHTVGIVAVNYAVNYIVKYLVLQILERLTVHSSLLLRSEH